MSKVGSRLSELAGEGPYIGRAMPRLEDERLVQGKGRYTDDFSLEGEAHAAFVRSPFGHARVVSIDAAEAAAAPGVIAVLTGADYVADGCKGISHFPNPADNVDASRRAFTSRKDRPVADLPHLPMPVDVVRHVGEPVAVVIAESAAAAQDAAELVEVDYEDLPAVVDSLEALAPDAPRLQADLPDNIAFEDCFGDREATEAALANAHLVVEKTFRNQRIANAQMEPRSAIGAFDAKLGIYTMIAGSQGAVRQRDTLAKVFGIPNDKVKVICPDVGGGFGPRTNLYPEQAVVVWAARRVGRPVRWTSTRSESFLSDFQGRDLVTRARLGFDREGKITGYAVDITGNVGAHTVSYVPMNNSSRIMGTLYDVPAAFAQMRGVLTNTVPTAPYRGAGRPEAVFAMERLLDIAAGRLGIDRVVLRERNILTRERLPHRTAMGLTYDSGDFLGNMKKALELADWQGFAARRAQAKARGQLAGIGLANYLESPVGIPHEQVEVSVLAEGRVEVIAGTQSTGQGHETSFAQVVADQLGVVPNQIRLITGDTSRVRVGGGTHSDRSMRLGGTLLMQASAEIVEQGKRVLASLHAVAPEAVAFKGGWFQLSGKNERVHLFELARAIEDGAQLSEELRRPLKAEVSFSGRIPAFPTGAAVCELEVNPDTGEVQIVRYSSIDDAGQAINPLIVHGQVHGGIVQGVGQALCEQVVAEAGTGQILTGSFMDYAMPRADMFPNFDVEMVEDPTMGNPLRVKGGGESGITPATAATINALVDALSEYGVEHIDMPATPLRVWEQIQQSEEIS
jgi:carbon-monoxide dehydrogenase large subunit